MWTQFWDMHSGGDRKESWNLIYIEAPIEEAKIIFYNRFGHNPGRVSCTCCGPDYSLSQDDDLAQLTAYWRGCEHDGERYVERQAEEFAVQDYEPLEQYLHSKDALFIYAAEIQPEERLGEVPRQGWVWA
jgi:hypothetical protein